MRRIYSSPSAHGAHLAAAVLTDPARFAAWQEEVAAMRNRILAMRHALYNALKAKMPDKNFDRLIRQRGMFGYTGFTPEQVRRLRDGFAVYLVDSGRMCVAGLNTGNIAYVAEAFAQVAADAV